METKKKIYAGSGKKQNETWMKASISFDEIEKHVQEYNGKRFVKININVGKPDKYGKDVSITIDDWQPTKQVNSPSVKESSGLPF